MQKARRELKETKFEVLFLLIAAMVSACAQKSGPTMKELRAEMDAKYAKENSCEPVLSKINDSLLGQDVWFNPAAKNRCISVGANFPKPFEKLKIEKIEIVPKPFISCSPTRSTHNLDVNFTLRGEVGRGKLKGTLSVFDRQYGVGRLLFHGKTRLGELGCLVPFNPRTKYNFTSKEWSAVLKGKIKIGMRPSQVWFILGKPNKVNSSGSKSRIVEQWVYGSIDPYNYLYFENGKLRSWQK